MTVRRPVPLRLPLFVFLCELLAACSGHPPEILRAELLPLFLRDPLSRTQSEYLAAFVLVEDQDGWEDLEALYVINDQERLYWTLTGRDLERKKKGGELWVGSSSLAMPDRRFPPHGYYRLQVRDFSGRWHETTAYLSPSDARPLESEFPVNGPAPADRRAWTYIFYRADGEAAGEIAPAQPARPAQAAAVPPGSVSFFIFKLDAARRLGLAAGPWAASEYAPGDR